MKYSLRSLIIVVAVAAVAVGAWRRHWQFCEGRREFHRRAIVKSPVFTGSHARPGTEEAGEQYRRWDASRRKHNEEHARLESEYQAAIFRPWLTRCISDPYVP